MMESFVSLVFTMGVEGIAAKQGALWLNCKEEAGGLAVMVRGMSIAAASLRCSLEPKGTPVSFAEAFNRSASLMLSDGVEGVAIAEALERSTGVAMVALVGFGAVCTFLL